MASRRTGRPTPRSATSRQAGGGELRNTRFGPSAGGHGHTDARAVPLVAQRAHPGVAGPGVSDRTTHPAPASAAMRGREVKATWICNGSEPGRRQRVGARIARESSEHADTPGRASLPQRLAVASTSSGRVFLQCCDTLQRRPPAELGWWAVFGSWRRWRRTLLIPRACRECLPTHCDGASGFSPPRRSDVYDHRDRGLARRYQLDARDR